MAPFRRQNLIELTLVVGRPAYGAEFYVGAVVEHEVVVLAVILCERCPVLHGYLLPLGVTVVLGYRVEHRGEGLLEHSGLKRREEVAEHEAVGFVRHALHDEPVQNDESLSRARGAVKEHFLPLAVVEAVPHDPLLAREVYVHVEASGLSTLGYHHLHRGACVCRSPICGSRPRPIRRIPVRTWWPL